MCIRVILRAFKTQNIGAHCYTFWKCGFLMNSQMIWCCWCGDHTLGTIDQFLTGFHNGTWLMRKEIFKGALLQAFPIISPIFLKSIYSLQPHCHFSTWPQLLPSTPAMVSLSSAPLQLIPQIKVMESMSPSSPIKGFPWTSRPNSKVSLKTLYNPPSFMSSPTLANPTPHLLCSF